MKVSRKYVSQNQLQRTKNNFQTRTKNIDISQLLFRLFQTRVARRVSTVCARRRKSNVKTWIQVLLVHVPSDRDFPVEARGSSFRCNMDRLTAFGLADIAAFCGIEKRYDVRNNMASNKKHGLNRQKKPNKQWRTKNNSFDLPTCGLHSSSIQSVCPSACCGATRQRAQDEKSEVNCPTLKSGASLFLMNAHHDGRTWGEKHPHTSSSLSSPCDSSR